MSIKVVLFDLDGTLLPMDQEVFVKAYFGGLTKALEPYGYKKEEMIQGIRMGLDAMYKNDGSCLNEKRFWDAFAGIVGEQVREQLEIFDNYYRNEFQLVKNVCGFAPKAEETVRKIKEMGYRVVLATNPLFPSIATESRMSWAGFTPEMFELYTTYENSRFCKPNLKYYEEIMEKLGVKPEECLMVGNDVGEDMVVEQLGMKTFLLTDDLINRKNVDISKYAQGSFEELLSHVSDMKSKNLDGTY